MAGFKTEKKNPGPANSEFTKRKNGISPRGSVPGSKGSAGSDEQFNKGKSYDDDDGSSAPSSSPGPGILKAGKPPGSKISSKSSGGTPGKFDGQKLSPAASIMREIAKASQKPPVTQKAKPQGKPAAAKSTSGQSKDFKNSASGSETGRSKSQVTQKVSQKKIQ